MASLGTLNSGNLISSSAAHSGGQGLLSITGTLAATGQPASVILEDDHTGTFEPSGDAVLHTSPSKLNFSLPASVNVRARITGADSSTAVEVHVS